MNLQNCDNLQCTRAAQYHAVCPRDPGVDGFFCYNHYPSGWVLELLPEGE